MTLQVDRMGTTDIDGEDPSIVINVAILHTLSAGRPQIGSCSLPLAPLPPGTGILGVRERD